LEYYLNFKINRPSCLPLHLWLYRKVAGTEGLRNHNLISLLVLRTIHATSSNKYAEMLSKKIQEADVKVWLINTGWTGGAYGSRMKLKYTRHDYRRLNGELDAVEYKYHAVLDLLYLKPVLMFLMIS
jgi:ATP-dependent phosphoenolpyruvate carboxykinase